MFDWLRAIARWLELYVIGMPLYFAAPAMILIGALDSSLLSLPEINDYLVVGRCIKYPSAVFYFPLFAAAGSVLGCLLLYTIMRRGGQAVLRKRFSLSTDQAKSRGLTSVWFSGDRYSRDIAAASAFQDLCGYGRHARVSALEVFVDRDGCTSFRYYVEGILAVFYGRRVLSICERQRTGDHQCCWLH